MVTLHNIQAYLKDRLANGVVDNVGSGAPTDGTTGVNRSGPGSTYTNKDNGYVYINIGTLAAPVWFSFNRLSNFCVRTRNTVAQVNAGYGLLSAIPGWSYCLNDAFAIAVGGAVGAVTTIDIIGTQAASAAKLVAFGQAALTRSTLVRAGSSGGVILADGASFIENDVNTGISIGKTGADITTATHIDTRLYISLVKA